MGHCLGLVLYCWNSLPNDVCNASSVFVFKVYCRSVTLHVNYCVTVLLLNCVRATVSTIRPGSPSVCLFVFV